MHTLERLQKVVRFTVFGNRESRANRRETLNFHHFSRRRGIEKITMPAECAGILKKILTIWWWNYARNSTFGAGRPGAAGKLGEI